MKMAYVPLLILSLAACLVTMGKCQADTANDDIFTLCLPEHSPLCIPDQRRAVPDGEGNKIQNKKQDVNNLKYLESLKAVTSENITTEHLANMDLVGIIAAIANKWTLADRIVLLTKIQNLNKQDILDQYGQLLNFNDAEPEDLNKFLNIIEHLSMPYLLNITDKKMQNEIFKTLSELSDGEMMEKDKIVMLAKKYYGSITSWSTETIRNVMSLIVYIPEYYIMNINSSNAVDTVTVLKNSKNIFLDTNNGWSANAYINVILRALNFSDAAHVAIYNQLSDVRPALRHIEALQPEHQVKVSSDYKVMTNLVLPFQSSLTYMDQNTAGPNMTAAEMKTFNEFIPTSLNVFLSTSKFDKGMIPSQLKANYLFPYVVNKLGEIFANGFKDSDGLMSIPEYLLPQVMNMEFMNNLSPIMLNQIWNVKISSLEFEQMVMFMEKVGCTKDFLKPTVVNVGDLAMAVYINETELSLQDMKTLIVNKSANNPILSYIYQKQNLSLQDIIKNISIMEFGVPSVLENLKMSEKYKLLVSEELSEHLSKTYSPKLVENMTMFLKDIQRQFIAIVDNSSLAKDDMFRLLPNLNQYPVSIAANVFDLQKILAEKRCPELLTNLPRTYDGLLNIGDFNKRESFGNFVLYCLKENTMYTLNVLRSSVIFIIPDFIESHVSDEDILTVWLTSDHYTNRCFSMYFAKVIADKLEKVLMPENVDFSTYKRLSVIIDFFSKDFQKNIPMDVVIEAENSIYFTQLSQKSKFETGKTVCKDKEYIKGMMMTESLNSTSKRNILYKVIQNKDYTWKNLARLSFAVQHLSMNELRQMKTEDVKETMDIFGAVYLKDNNKRNLILGKAIMAVNGLENATTNDLKNMNYLLLSLAPSSFDEEKGLKINSWERVNIFSKISSYYNQNQLKSIAGNIMRNLKNITGDITSAELANLENILCGFPLDDIKKLNFDFFMKNDFILRRLDNCNKDALMILGELAISVYGTTDKWNSLEFIRLGSIVGGLETSKFMNLPWKAFDGIQANGVRAINFENAMVLTKDQLSAIPKSCIWEFNAAQISRFSMETRKMYDKVTGYVAKATKADATMVARNAALISTAVFFSIGTMLFSF